MCKTDRESDAESMCSDEVVVGYDDEDVNTSPDGVDSDKPVHMGSSNPLSMIAQGRMEALENLVHTKNDEIKRLRESAGERITCVSNELARVSQSFVEHKELAFHEMQRERVGVAAGLEARKTASNKVVDIARSIIATGDAKIAELECVVDEQQRLIQHLEDDLCGLRASRKKSRADRNTTETSGDAARSGETVRSGGVARSGGSRKRRRMSQHVRR